MDIAVIWRRMFGLYGPKWSSQYGRALNEQKRLSGLAQEWQRGLAGITTEQLDFGFAALESDILNTQGEAWPLPWPDFKKLCLAPIFADVPSLDKIVSMLIGVSSRQGSLARRYQHPMSLAVSLACRRDGVDMFAIRNAKFADAKRMIKPAYENCLKTGWNDWAKEDLQEPDGTQKALGHEKPVNKAVGRNFFSGIKVAL